MYIQPICPGGFHVAVDKEGAEEVEEEAFEVQTYTFVK